MGYSPGFVHNMRRIVDSLRSGVAELVLVDRPDAVCSACPHLIGKRCGKAAESEEAVSRADRFVISRLGWQPGERANAATVLERLAARISMDEMDTNVCADCEWREHGFCREGLADLQRMMASGDG